jgi:uncharacterized protein (TIGR02246 family)
MKEDHMCADGRNLLWVLAFLAMAVAACTQPPAAGNVEADVRAIQAITDRFDEAVNAGDYEALALLYHEDAMRMPADAPPQIGQAAIREWFRTEAEQFRIEIDNVVREAQVFGDWGYCWGDATGTLTARDESGTRVIDSKWMSVSRRMADGSWKVYRDIYNANDPALSPDADLAAIAAVRTQLQTALREDDVAGIMAGLTDNHLTMPPDQPAPPDNEALAAWHQARVDQYSWAGEMATDEVRIYGNIAIERWSGTTRVIPKAGGEEITDSTKGVWIWERQADGSWKLLWSVWNSSLPADQGL